MLAGAVARRGENQVRVDTEHLTNEAHANKLRGAGVSWRTLAACSTGRQFGVMDGLVFAFHSCVQVIN